MNVKNANWTGRFNTSILYSAVVELANNLENVQKSRDSKYRAILEFFTGHRLILRSTLKIPCVIQPPFQLVWAPYGTATRFLYPIPFQSSLFSYPKHSLYFVIRRPYWRTVWRFHLSVPAVFTVLSPVSSLFWTTTPPGLSLRLAEKILCSLLRYVNYRFHG